MDVFAGEGQVNLLRDLLQIQIDLLAVNPDAHKTANVAARLRDAALRAKTRAATAAEADEQATWHEVSAASNGLALCLDTPDSPTATYNEASAAFKQTVAKAMSLPLR
jgi:hypothetical protein